MRAVRGVSATALVRGAAQVAGRARQVGEARQAGEAREAGPGRGRMLAWRVHGYGGPDELRLEEVRVPPLRAPDEVLVRVRAASINPLDVAMLGGYGARLLNAARALEGAEGEEFPLVPGRDFVGDVCRAGPAPGARALLGRRVWGALPPYRPGAHQQHVLARAAWVCEAPDALSDVEAGGVPYAALSACAALRAAGVERREAGAGPRVLLLGLGGVGHAALQLLVHRGAQVVVGCSGELCERATALGAVAAFDRHSAEYFRLLEESGPYRAVLDCAGLGGEAAAGEAARAWQFARYVTLSPPLLREADARGVAAGLAAAAGALLRQSAAAALARPDALPPPHVRWAFFAPGRGDLLELRRLADEGRFAVAVERVFPWHAAREGYERAAGGHARGKLLLDFTAPAPVPAPAPAPAPAAQCTACKSPHRAGHPLATPRQSRSHSTETAVI